jgi:chromosomal replication initiation ATPase DnaA
MSYIDDKRSLIREIQILELENEALRKQVKELKSMSHWTIPSRKLDGSLLSDQKHAAKIIEQICDFYGVTAAQIKGKCRLRGYVKARFVAIFLLRTRTGLTLKEIGRMFHRDHTSMIHAIKTINEVMSLKFENDYKDEIERLLKII